MLWIIVITASAILGVLFAGGIVLSFPTTILVIIADYFAFYYYDISSRFVEGDFTWAISFALIFGAFALDRQLQKTRQERRRRRAFESEAQARAAMESRVAEIRGNHRPS